MAKNSQNSRFGGKSRHICANLAIFSLFTGVTSLLITFSTVNQLCLFYLFHCVGRAVFVCINFHRKALPDSRGHLAVGSERPSATKVARVRIPPSARFFNQAT